MKAETIYDLCSVNIAWLIKEYCGLRPKCFFDENWNFNRMENKKCCNCKIVMRLNRLEKARKLRYPAKIIQTKRSENTICWSDLALN